MDRDELHDRIMLLKEELDAGRVKFAQHLRVVDSLKRVRYAADGKIDPASVDADVRALANMVVYLRQREELKKIPLADVQAAYFDFLERFFSKPYSEMKKHGVSPHDIARGMAATPSLVKAYEAEGEEFAAGIRDFWESFGPVVHAHLEDLGCLKSVYGGDIFPSYTSNIACSVGLYMDTIVLPDPLLKTSRIVHQAKTDSVVYYLAKHALNALSYKELALADVEPPIVVIAPERLAIEESMHQYLRASAEADLLEHSSRLFGRSFPSVEKLASFLERQSTPEDVASCLADPTRLLFDTEWSGPVPEQINRYIKETLRNFRPELVEGNAGYTVQLALIGRMMQTNAMIWESSWYRGTPLVDAPTSWQYLLWKYEYDRERFKEFNADVENVFISKALEAEGSRELGLISGLPPEALIELRRRGALAELRETIRKGIDEIDSAEASTLAEVTETVTANISAALSKHKEELAELSSARRFFGVNVAPWVAVGGLSIAAASTGNILLSILAASAGTLGAPTAKDLWRQAKTLLSKGEQLKRSPTGILYRHLNK